MSKRPIFEDIGQCGLCTAHIGRGESRDPEGNQTIPENRIREYRHQNVRGARMGRPIYSGPGLDAMTAGAFLHEENEG